MIGELGIFLRSQCIPNIKKLFLYILSDSNYSDISFAKI